MSPVETMEVDSPVTEVEAEITKKEVKDVDTTATEGGYSFHPWLKEFHLKLIFYASHATKCSENSR